MMQWVVWTMTIQADSLQCDVNGNLAPLMGMQE